MKVQEILVGTYMATRASTDRLEIIGYGHKGSYICEKIKFYQKDGVWMHQAPEIITVKSGVLNPLTEEQKELFYSVKSHAERAKYDLLNSTPLSMHDALSVIDVQKEYLKTLNCMKVKVFGDRYSYVMSFQEAIQIIRLFIENTCMGSSKWLGDENGTVYDIDNKPIARIAYNGTCWEYDPNPVNETEQIFDLNKKIYN